MSTFRARYPYEHETISVMAQACDSCGRAFADLPTGTTQQWRDYIEVRRLLGDDWATDVLESAPEVYVSILTQCRAHAEVTA